MSCRDRKSVHKGEERRRIAEDVAFGLAIAMMFIAVRYPLYTNPGVVLGWNSDAALYGLMARAMVEAGEPIFLFWGSNYLGTLTAMWAVAAAAVVGEVGPLALRMGVATALVVAIVLFAAGLARAYGRAAAMLGAAWLAAGPLFFFKLSYAPVSAEQMFFVGSVVFWHTARAPFERRWQWVVLGLLAGIGWWAHRGALFVVVPAVAIGLFGDKWVSSWRRATVAGLCFAIGAGVGLLPQVIGMREINQRLYIPLVPPWSASHVAEQFRSLIQSDFPRFLGVEQAAFPRMASLVILGFVIYVLTRLRLNREHWFAVGVAITTFGFWLFSGQAYPGATRYLILALPIVYTWIARGAVDLLRGGGIPRAIAGGAIALVATAGLYTQRHMDARAVAAGQREQHEHWPGGFDPRPALDRIARERYSVCYANFWLAYKLEWLSPTGVKFIPYRSVNLSHARSLALASSPGKKCFVTLDGDVQTLTPAQEAHLRQDTVRLIRGAARDTPRR